MLAHMGLILTVVIAMATPAAAGELRYLGKSVTPGRGHILHEGQPYEVDRDTDIPGWGRVKDITDTMLIVDYELTDADKEQIRAAGGAPHDFKRTLVPRDDLRQIVVPGQ